MIFKSKLQPATLVKRYKRFLADVRLPDNQVITVYCPNTGSMRSCSTPGNSVYISRSDNPNRKYAFTLEMIKEDTTWVGVNTILTNQIVAEAIANNEIAELKNMDSVQREVKVSSKSRLDLLLCRGTEKIYVEIKNCSLVENGIAMFPDAVTVRGTKHLYELEELVGQGYGGVIFFLVQRSDAVSFRPAAHIDAQYAKALSDVHNKGVRILVYQAEVTSSSITIVGSLPFSLE